MNLNMNIRTNPGAVLVLLALLTTLLACNLLTRPAMSPTQAPPTPAPPTQLPPTLVPQPASTTAAGETSKLIQQWVAEAEASSEYDSTDWSAKQITGEPNTPNCGDAGTAWAAVNQDTREWINVYFKVPVYPTEVHIIETYYPDQVAQVDLIDMQGQFVTAYTGQPKQVDSPCPYPLSISVSQDNILAQGVRITIDQSVLRNWNQIDAVEIVGVPGEGTPVRPATPSP
jgi:hypothetical protein